MQSNANVMIILPLIKIWFGCYLLQHQTGFEVTGDNGKVTLSLSNFAEAVQVLARGAVRLDPWIVEAPLVDGSKWFDQLIDAHGNVAKVLLVP
jgi:hypothetical protein